MIVSDPLDFDTFDKLRFILNRKIEIALATKESILEAINRNYGQIEGEVGRLDAAGIHRHGHRLHRDRRRQRRRSTTMVDETSAPIVRLVQLMISEAVQLRASDIHVEPFEDRVRIRYRIDGVLVERDSPPRRLLGALLSRIKILAKMDIAERRRRQDGRIKITVGDKELDLRVSMLPDQPRPVVRHAAAGQGQHQGRRPAAGAVGARTSRSSTTSSAGRTASSWSRARPARARRPRSTPR